MSDSLVKKEYRVVGLTPSFESIKNFITQCHISNINYSLAFDWADPMTGKFVIKPYFKVKVASINKAIFEKRCEISLYRTYR